jgi:hypothetical protein
MQLGRFALVFRGSDSSARVSDVRSRDMLSFAVDDGWKDFVSCAAISCRVLCFERKYCWVVCENGYCFIVQ